jgi:hypothetical protein
MHCMQRTHKGFCDVSANAEVLSVVAANKKH